MRKSRRKQKQIKKFFFISTAISIATIFAGYKSISGLAGLTNLKIDFSSEPIYYTGETDYFENSFVESEEIISNGFGWENESEYSLIVEDTDSGEKPYPEKWNTSDATVYKYTFERYSGDKFIGLENGGQVMNETEVSNAKLLEESKLLPDFQIELNDEPQVLIMHTHTTESFEPFERENFDTSFNYRTTDPTKNVIMIGDEITSQLENSGIAVIHNTTIHDYPSYNGSYDRSYETITDILEKYPSIKVVLDIHRDAIGTNESIMQPVIEVDGKEAAQVMIISGCDDGTMNMPNYMQNFRFASLLQQQMSKDYNGLTRPILFDYRNYNQELTTGSLLIEVGSHGNTLEQVKYSGELIGKSLAKALLNLVSED